MKLFLILLFVSILTDVVESKQNYTKEHKPRHTPNPQHIKRFMEDYQSPHTNSPTSHAPNPHKPTHAPTPSPTPTIFNNGGILLFI